MTSSSFDLDTIDNTIQDGDKMFAITIRLISTCLPVTINSDTTTVTIIDDEGIIVSIHFMHAVICIHLVLRIQFASTMFSGLESSGEMLVTVNKMGGTSTGTLSVNVGFSEATATGWSSESYYVTYVYNKLIVGYDFNTTSLTATILPGITNTTVRVAVTDDNIVEGEEVFSMSLTVPSYLGPGIAAGLVTNATGIIIDTTGT